MLHGTFPTHELPVIVLFRAFVLLKGYFASYFSENNNLMNDHFEVCLHLKENNFLAALLYNDGHSVAKLVEALCYTPEGRGFDSRWCH